MPPRGASVPKRLRCAIYTRKSSEEGLEQDFNSLDAQRGACEAYVASQAHEGWQLVPTRFDDGGYSGGTLDRPALQTLLAAIKARRIDIVVIYKIDRLSRSLLDFARLAETFDAHGVSFVSVTQSFNTTTSMGRLMLNVLLSFAQFEREVTGERIRDKIAASKQKGLWMGGHVPFGYRAQGRTLVPDPVEAETVRTLYRLYRTHGCVRLVHSEALQLGLTTRRREWTDGRQTGGGPFSRGHLYRILNNPLYVGRIRHKGHSYPGSHPGLVDEATFTAVQSGLAGQTHQHRTPQNHRSPSLLAGLLVDGEGQRYRATHAVKNGRRYRYYTHPALVTGKPRAHLPLRRVPAPAVEKAVLAALEAFLSNADSLVAALGAEAVPLSARELQAAGATLLGRLAAESPVRIEVLQRLAPRIQLAPGSLRVAVSHSSLRVGLGLTSLSASPLGTCDVHEIVVPSTMRSRQGLERLVFGSRERDAEPKVDRTLVAAIVRGQKWWGQIESGQYRSIAALAAAERLSGSYITRVLRLAFLAPALIAEVVKGMQSSDLTARRLLNHPALPHQWQGQREELRTRYG